MQRDATVDTAAADAAAGHVGLRLSRFFPLDGVKGKNKRLRLQMVLKFYWQPSQENGYRCAGGAVLRRRAIVRVVLTSCAPPYSSTRRRLFYSTEWLSITLFFSLFTFISLFILPLSSAPRATFSVLRSRVASTVPLFLTQSVTVTFCRVLVERSFSLSLQLRFHPLDDAYPCDDKWCVQVSTTGQPDAPRDLGRGTPQRNGKIVRFWTHCAKVTIGL